MLDMSIKDLCNLAGVSRQTEYNWRLNGKGPAYTEQRIGKKTYIRYPIASTVHWIAKNKPERERQAKIYMEFA